jgi:hypothetical protein
MAAQSDPDRNYHFSRRWSGPPLESKRPPTGDTVQRARKSISSSDLINTKSSRILQWACRLDRAADVELQHGHVAIAERLSRQAAELREAGR